MCHIPIRHRHRARRHRGGVDCTARRRLVGPYSSAGGDAVRQGAVDDDPRRKLGQPVISRSVGLHSSRSSGRGRSIPRRIHGCRSRRHPVREQGLRGGHQRLHGRTMRCGRQVRRWIIRSGFRYWTGGGAQGDMHQAVPAAQGVSLAQGDGKITALHRYGQHPISDAVPRLCGQGDDASGSRCGRRGGCSGHDSRNPSIYTDETSSHPNDVHTVSCGHRFPMRADRGHTASAGL